MSELSANQPRVVICGGGVIGASIAYFLSRRNVSATVIERTGIGHAASGKSGGFLALDWCRGTAVDALARRSFSLHAELAEELKEELGLDWGYRRIDTLSVVASQQQNLSNRAHMEALDWLGPHAAVHAQIGNRETTAQIHPEEFTKSLMQAAQAAGAELMAGTVEGVALSEDGRRITGALVDGKVMQADIVVIAMGPWSILACQWLPLPAVYGLKGHSLVFRYTPSQPRALFVEIETETGEIETPEVVPRTDGTTYVCGLSSQPPLPVDPSEVVGDEGAHDRLLAMTATFAPELGAAEVLAEQACYRPITTDGMPLIGRVPGIGGAFVATGHSVWGMLNGPATGEALAELIVDGAATTVDITPFNPARLPLFEGSVE
ncbi:MAG: NAD(P)/FAD-dependent oxidoreductase [Candidatus Latescibacterota bacterium]|jgi:glycine/D-amino acid oxidase-like deaminating enzyme